MDDRRRAFVIGHPIDHSRSPMIHGFWLHEHGIDGAYEALDIVPEEVGGFLSGLDRSHWAGGNVTIPHKRAAFDAIASRDGAAEAIGAVNTIWRENGALRAGNTDAYGFTAGLDDQAPHWRDGARALVIGAGGASRAIVHALLAAGYGHVDVINRTVSRAQEIAERFGRLVIPGPFTEIDHLAAGADLIVNTTSLGMPGHPPLEIDFDRLSDAAVATDIVYWPLVTPFLAGAAERGLTTVDGLGMLLHQAVPGFERWFGVRPSVSTRLRALVVDDLKKAGQT